MLKNDAENDSSFQQNKIIIEKDLDENLKDAPKISDRANQNSLSKNTKSISKSEKSAAKKASEIESAKKEDNINDQYAQELEELKADNPSAHEYVVQLDQMIEKGYGTHKPLADEHLKREDVKSVVEALNNKSNPERLSAAIKPKDFDQYAFENDSEYREKYLNTIEPGRVHQAKQPSEDTPAIKRISPYYLEAFQGDTVTLKVKALAGFPVTFKSFDLGMFENGLTTQTVLCDSRGIAKVNFKAEEGTAANCRILVSSPMTSGQVRFNVFIKL